MSESFLTLLFLATSMNFDLPPKLIDSLCFVESSHRPSAVHKDDGGGSSLGVCQVKLTTARALGFLGNEKQLMDPYTNIYFAGRYLDKQIVRYHGDLHKAVAAYNTGTYRPDDQGKPMNKKYVDKVFKEWRSRK